MVLAFSCLVQSVVYIYRIVLALRCLQLFRMSCCNHFAATYNSFIGSSHTRDVECVKDSEGPENRINSIVYCHSNQTGSSGLPGTYSQKRSDL